jgi:glycosyltransferase involved in cell wall biosynthesis
LISPLWNDQRSMARFPTKIASYLFAARPVLTCDVGETGKYLKDLENALFFEPGDESGLCQLMERCALDQSLANQIGREGYHLASGSFDFRRHSEKLNNLFELAIT